MKNLTDPARATEITSRTAKLRIDSPRQWGKMTAPQALAHMSIAMEAALGDRVVPRLCVGRIFGRLVKWRVLRDDAPIVKNAPTAPSAIVAGQPDLERERQRFVSLVNRFATGGAAACTTNPHAFFGRLTPDEWAILMYKHADHHLRQFGV